MYTLSKHTPMLKLENKKADYVSRDFEYYEEGISVVNPVKYKYWVNLYDKVAVYKSYIYWKKYVYSMYLVNKDSTKLDLRFWINQLWYDGISARISKSPKDIVKEILSLGIEDVCSDVKYLITDRTSYSAVRARKEVEIALDKYDNHKRQLSIAGLMDGYTKLNYKDIASYIQVSSSTISKFFNSHPREAVLLKLYNACYTFLNMSQGNGKRSIDNHFESYKKIIDKTIISFHKDMWSNKNADVRTEKVLRLVSMIQLEMEINYPLTLFNNAKKVLN